MNMNTPERTLFVMPVAGRIVPDPARDGADLPAEGCYVSRSPYWLRAISAGDVKEVDSIQSAKKTKGE